MMPDEGNLDPGCSRLHHDEYEASGGLITHLQSLNSQSNGRGEGGAPGRGGCVRNVNAIRDDSSAVSPLPSLPFTRGGKEVRSLKKKQVF